MMNSFKPKKISGPKEPNDIKTPLPKIDKSQIRVRDTLDAEEDDDLTPLGTLMGGALRALRARATDPRRRGLCRAGTLSMIHPITYALSNTLKRSIV